MSKRVRGPVRTQRRPGARPPSQSTTRRAQVSQLEAAELIAEDMIDQHPAEAAAELEKAERSLPMRARMKPGSILAAKAATEYVYVAQDLRRIIAVAALLFGIMFALWILFEVARIRI